MVWVFIASAIFNCVAVTAGLHAYLGLPWWLAGLAGLASGNIPFFGCFLAGAATMVAWHWPLWAAAAVAIGPSLLMLPLAWRGRSS